MRENALIISGRKAGEEGERTFLHRGIATRAFERRFHLAEHVRATGATVTNGMLDVELVRRGARGAEAAPHRDHLRRDRPDGRDQGGRGGSRLIHPLG